MNYLSTAEQQVYKAFTNWTPRPFSKADELVADIVQANEDFVNVAVVGSPFKKEEIEKLGVRRAQLVARIAIVFGYSEERNKLALAALTEAHAVRRLLDMYPNVRVNRLAAEKPTKGQLAFALAGRPETELLGAKAWFGDIVKALKQIHKLPDYYLVYSGVGPTKAIIHRAAIETKNPLLYGMAVPAAAQKAIIALFNVRELRHLRTILEWDLHLDETFNGGETVAIASRTLEGFLQNHRLLDFDHCGHKATFFTKL